jgi:hypothetical protein
MARPEPIRPNGSKIGKLVGSFCETPTTRRPRLTQMPCNFANGCELALGRAHHDFNAAIGTLLFD